MALEPIIVVGRSGVGIREGANALVRNANLEKIRRVSSKAEAANPLTLPEGGLGLATITPKAFASPTAGLTQAVYFSRNYPEYGILRGGVVEGKSNGFGTWSASHRSGGNFSSTKNNIATRYSWYTDSINQDLYTLFDKYRLLIDGQYVGKTVRTDGLTSGGFNILNIQTTDTTRKMRRFDIEITGNGLIGGLESATLTTFKLGPNDSIAPVPTVDMLRIAVLGDSFSASTGASFNALGWAYDLGYRLAGIDADVHSCSIGGTGFINTSSSPTQYTALERITQGDLSHFDYDIVITALGINDSGLSGIQAAALSTFQAIRAAQPNALVIVLGAWCGQTGPSANLLLAEQAIQAAFTQWADVNSRFIPVSPTAPRAWISPSTGVVISQPDAPGGGSPDGTHPGNVGHSILGDRAAAAIRSSL